MSRQSSVQRPLTLTEELEKLEQSITLTLQEIDHNFSQAHRIVTTSILPLVEQYAEHSRDVWEGAKFWKQFFEASANVSLSGYEEHPNEETTQEQTATEDESNATESNITESTSYDTPSSNRHDTPGKHEDIDLSSLSLSSHSTPRAQPPHEKPANDTTPSSITTASPYETLKQQITESDSPFEIQDPSALPSTPGRSPSKKLGFSPSPSPFIPPTSTEQQPSTKHQKPTDPVMHRLFDKTYRVQATPLGKGFENNRSKFTVTPKPKPSSSSKYPMDDSPLSSPEPEAPQLNSELFSSPVKGVAATPTPRKTKTDSHHERITPKPGISVLTPAKGKGESESGRGRGKRPVWDSDEEEFDDGDNDGTVSGPSPPKTMQFHVPQSRLMKTPAKEASKRIVEDLLVSAGANDVTESVEDEQSPSVVRRVGRLEDETF